MPRAHRTQPAATPPTHPGLGLLPLQVEALTLLFPAVWTSRPSSQCLPSPAHALTLTQFVCLYQLCLPSELRAVSGSSPHPTAGQGHVRASVRMRRDIPPCGQTQLCARPPKTWEEVLGLAVRPLLSPRGPTLGDPGTHFQNPHTFSGSAIWSVSRSTPILPPSCITAFGPAPQTELSSHHAPL